MKTRSYLVREEHIPDRAAFPVIDAHNHLWGNWAGVDSMVGMMDQVGIVCYCDLTANVSLAWVEGGYMVSQGSFEGFLTNCVERHPGRFYGFTTATLAQPGNKPLFRDVGNSWPRPSRCCAARGPRRPRAEDAQRTRAALPRRQREPGPRGRPAAGPHLGRGRPAGHSRAHPPVRPVWLLRTGHP